MDTEKVENAAGGKGYILRQKLLSDEQLNGKNGMFVRITLLNLDVPWATMNIMTTQKLIMSFPVKANTTTTASSEPSKQVVLLIRRTAKNTA